MKYILLAIFLTGCSGCAEVPKVTLPASAPAELGVYPVCADGRLAGIRIATSGAGVWNLQVPENACRDWI